MHVMMYTNPDTDNVFVNLGEHTLSSKCCTCVHRWVDQL